MATKTIAWTTGSGNITLTYTGQGNGSISVSSNENDLFEDREQSFGIVTTAGTPERALSILVKQKGKTYPVGEVFNFAYTGSVQQITLPKGKYKLQCWGAQGGTSYGSSSGAGSKGGYSEGVITITETTTFYIFVGGQGSRGYSTSLVNGGWNGGGASVGYSSYNSGDTNGYSYPACGGGATDISTVTSSMSYSSGRTNRSSASLLARCIVAGGGAGGSYSYTEVTTTTSTTKEVYIGGASRSAFTQDSSSFNSSGQAWFWSPILSGSSGWGGKTIRLYSYGGDSYYNPELDFCKITSSGSKSYIKWSRTPPHEFTLPNDMGQGLQISFYYGATSLANKATSGIVLDGFEIYEVVNDTTTNTSTSSGYSNKSQQGGGTSGKGQYPGTQSAGGNGNGDDGGFGYGGSQKITNYRYCSGGAGGGWYGGGTAYSDSSTSYINYSGGGSGFVNTAANASYRPSGYTGLQLDSGTTKDGSTSFKSTSGGTETGHSGNGYARITVIE